MEDAFPVLAWRIFRAASAGGGGKTVAPEGVASRSGKNGATAASGEWARASSGRPVYWCDSFRSGCDVAAPFLPPQTTLDQNGYVRRLVRLGVEVGGKNWSLGFGSHSNPLGTRLGRDWHRWNDST